MKKLYNGDGFVQKWHPHDFSTLDVVPLFSIDPGTGIVLTFGEGRVASGLAPSLSYPLGKIILPFRYNELRLYFVIGPI